MLELNRPTLPVRQEKRHGTMDARGANNRPHFISLTYLLWN